MALFRLDGKLSYPNGGFLKRRNLKPSPVGSPPSPDSSDGIKTYRIICDSISLFGEIDFIKDDLLTIKGNRIYRNKRLKINGLISDMEISHVIHNQSHCLQPLQADDLFQFDPVSGSIKYVQLFSKESPRISTFPINIGRSSLNCFPAPWHVSSHHALLQIAPDHPWKLFLLDLGSTNGTSVNKRKLIPGCRYQIFDGDWIIFGHSENQFQIRIGYLKFV
jgi:FHA domain